MTNVGSLVVLGLFVVLLLLTRPTPRRVVVRLVSRVRVWATTHWKRTEESDREENELWMMERRRKLCADLRRVEHLVATDAWMSATRQRANRIAYNQLVDDLRHSPDIFSATFQPQIFGSSDEFGPDPRSTGLISFGVPEQPRAVEVLEIGPRRRRRRCED